MHPVVRVRAASKRYGDHVALADVSIEVCRGQIVGLIGANGAGKTTLIRAIVGLLRLDAGHVEKSEAAREKGRMTYLPEERGLYARQTPFDTLRYLAELRGASGQAAAACARDWLQRVRIEDGETKRLEQFSKGQQQRVQLAAAFMLEPALVVLDEPFSGLDPLNVRSVRALVREARDRGAAVLLSAHQLHLVAELCDSIVMLASGRVVVAGATRDIVSSERDLESIFLERSEPGGTL